MKGVFFKKPLEYNIEVFGENWHQGQKLSGILLIKNHSSSTISLNEHIISIQMGVLKKIKEKDTKGFDPIEIKSLTTDQLKEIEAQDEVKVEFDFSLKENSFITEKTKSLYLSAGPKDSIFDGALLQLNITPNPAIVGFLEILTNAFKFKVKSIKNKKETLEAKIIPPKSKELGAVMELLLNLRLDQDILYLNYVFKVEKFSTEHGIVTTIKDSIKIKKELSKNQYYLFENELNRDEIQKSIKETLGVITKQTTIL